MKGVSIKEEEKTSFELVDPSQLVIYGGRNDENTKDEVKKSPRSSRDKEFINKNELTKQQQQHMTLHFNLVTTAYVDEDGTIDRTVTSVSNKSPVNATNTAQQPPPSTNSAQPPPPPAIDRSRKPIKSNNTTPTNQQQEKQMMKSKL